MEKELIIPLSHPVRLEDATRTQVLWIAGDKFTVRESKRARMKYTASQCGGKRLSPSTDPGSQKGNYSATAQSSDSEKPTSSICSPRRDGWTDRRTPLFALPARGRGERPGREPHRSPPPGSPAQQFNKVCFPARAPFGGCHRGKWLSPSVCGCRFRSGVGVEGGGWPRVHRPLDADDPSECGASPAGWGGSSLLSLLPVLGGLLCVAGAACRGASGEGAGGSRQDPQGRGWRCGGRVLGDWRLGQGKPRRGWHGVAGTGLWVLGCRWGSLGLALCCLQCQAARSTIAPASRELWSLRSEHPVAHVGFVVIISLPFLSR
ncbi:uncharacterized protein [Anser cygnoides]|uniref:uncharacterized protein n=1 Tax=Anser cygnoides TaxID=8845 RepID=UPI0034D1C0AA